MSLPWRISNVMSTANWAPCWDVQTHGKDFNWSSRLEIPCGLRNSHTQFRSKPTRKSCRPASVKRNSWARAEMWLPRRIARNPRRRNNAVNCARLSILHVVKSPRNQLQPTLKASLAWTAPSWTPQAPEFPVQCQGLMVHRPSHEKHVDW